MKTVIVEKEVRDPAGLLASIRASDSGYRVLNVGVDARRTYVYLEPGEERDPAPLVHAWRDPAVIRLGITNRVAPDGVLEALSNGADLFRIEIDKVDPDTGEGLPGEEDLRIRIRGPRGVSIERLRLANGRATVPIGPCDRPGPVQVLAWDPRLKLGRAGINLRFVPEFTPDPPPPEEEAPLADPGQDGMDPEAGVREPEPQSEGPLKESFWTRLLKKFGGTPT